MLKHKVASFEREIWQRIEYFFRTLPRSKIFFPLRLYLGSDTHAYTLNSIA